MNSAMRERQTRATSQERRLHEEPEQEDHGVEHQQNEHVLLPGCWLRRAAGGQQEPLVEARPGDAGVEFLGEIACRLQELVTFRRVEPGLQVRLGVEAHDGEPILLHAGHRRLEAIALETRGPRLGSSDALLPGAVGGLLAGFDARRDHRRNRGGQHARVSVIDDVDVVAADAASVPRVPIALAAAAPISATRPPWPCRRSAAG